MKNNIRFWERGILILLAACTAIIFSHQVGEAQSCSLDMTFSQTHVQQLSPADIDFEHFESKTLLFSINITNSSGANVNAKFEGSLDIDLADGTQFIGAGTFETNEFNVPPGGRMITNLNLGRNADIGTSKFEFEDAAKNKLQDIALATGKFPAGKYVFHIKLRDVGCGQVVKTIDIIFDLQSMSRIELRAPRDGEPINEFPLFEWFHEGESVVLTVVEMNPNQSREDAITRQPPILEVELVGQNSFFYSGGRPLEQGKEYAWRVASQLRGGDTPLSSSIWTFRVSKSGEGGPEAAIMNQLEEIFGKQFAAIFEQLRSGGFKLSGRFDLNGTLVSANDLLKLLHQLRNNDSIEISFK